MRDPKITGWSDYNQIKKEIAQLTKERDEAKAKCAEMRDALTACLSVTEHRPTCNAVVSVTRRGFVKGCDCGINKVRDAIRRALSTDCDKGWKSPEEYAALEARVAEMREALSDTQRLLLFLANDIDYASAEEERRAQAPIVQLASKIAHLESSDCGKGCGRGYVPVSELDATLNAERLFIDWCKTPERVVTPEVIEAIHEDYARLQALKEGK